MLVPDPPTCYNSLLTDAKLQLNYAGSQKCTVELPPLATAEKGPLG